MRIRTIKPEFFEDEHLAKLPPHDRILFIGLWCLADANGVLEHRPEWIKSRCFPYESGEAVDASQMLHRLFTGGFINEFESDGRTYIFIPTFKKHQRLSGKEAQAGGKFPLPELKAQKKKHRGSTWEAPGKHLGAQEQGTGNREQGKDMNTLTSILALSPTDSTPEEPKKEAHQKVFVSGFIVQGASNETWDLSEEDAEQLRNGFPHIDIMQECLKAKAWLFANPERRKTKRGMKKFLFSWFERSNNNGRAAGMAQKKKESWCAADLTTQSLRKPAGDPNAF